MANAYARQHSLLQVHGDIRHSAPDTGGAKAALFAGKSHQLGVPAVTTHEV